MANYYELLKVQPTASSSEIEFAIETRYNQLRRLVTHHDPNVVSQATQTIRLLEQIRGTLCNEAKRANYDEAIGLRGAMAGLTDPEAVLRNFPAPAVMTPPSRLNSAQAVATTTATTKPDLWDCPKCHTTNPPMSEHCFKCGTQLLRVCPECNGKTSLITTNVCGKCGLDYDLASQRKDLQQTILKFAMDDGELVRQLEKAKKTKNPGFLGTILDVAMVASSIGAIALFFSDIPEVGIILLFPILFILAPMVIFKTYLTREASKKVLDYEQRLSENREKSNQAQQAYDHLTKNS